MLLKQFAEDKEAEKKKEGEDLLKHQAMLSKFKRLRRMQQEKENQLGAANDDEPESLHSLISEIKEEYLSDL